MFRTRPIDPGVLGCVVAGYEKGGTTLLKDLLRSTGRMQSAFEGGLLLAERPARGIPEPYATQLVQSWRLPDDFLARYRRCASFEAGYRLLRQESRRCHKHLPLVDKTPRYMACLADVLRRAPGTPVVVVLRDPLQVAGSWLRLGKTVANAAAAIRASTVGLVSAPLESLSAVSIIQLADVVADPAAACARLQAWLGREHVPYDATHHLGTSPPGEPPPRGVDADRIAIEEHWSAAEIAAMRGELRSLLPWSDLVARVPSGPLSEVLADARPLWEAVATAEGRPCPIPARGILSRAGARRGIRPRPHGGGSTLSTGWLSRRSRPTPPAGDHAPIPRDVLGCIVAGYVRGGATRLKNLLVQTTDMRIGFAGGLLLAERPADGIPEPHGGNLLAHFGLDARFLDRYRRCQTFEAGYRLVRAAASPRGDRSAPLLDKTPHYLTELAGVMRRAPGTPVVVVVRDPLHVLVSWLRLGMPRAEALASIRAATESLQAVLAHPRLAESVYIVSFEDLTQHPDAILAPLRKWLGRWPRGVLSPAPAARGDESDGRDDAGRCPVEELEHLRRELCRAVPAAPDVAALRSGPAAATLGRLSRAA